MKKPPKTWLLVEALPDENDVLYLVADPRAPHRKVGVKFKDVRPTSPDHFAEHFEPHAHLVEVENGIHLAHYRAAAAAQTLKILHEVQAATHDEAVEKIASHRATQAPVHEPPAPVPTTSQVALVESTPKQSEAPSGATAES